MLLNKYFSSVERNAMSQVNGDSINLNNVVDEEALVETMDPDLNMELEQLKLEHLKLQEAQLLCKQRLLLRQAEKKASIQSSATNRSFLPDGRIIVHNSSNSERAGNRDGDGSHGGSSADLPNIPGLQRVACVVCGSTADSYCERCGVTHYCSTQCQRRDWTRRHKAVCHNLAKLLVENSQPKKMEVAETVPTVEPAPPLRRPRSPQQRESREPARRNDSNDNDKHPRKLMPPGQQQSSNKSNNNNGRGGFRNNNRGGFSYRGSRTPANRTPGSRPPLRHDQSKEEDEDGGTPTPKETKPEPKSAFSQSPNKTHPSHQMNGASPTTLKPQLVAKKEIAEEKKVASPQTKEIVQKEVPKSPTIESPKVQTVPKNYMIETLSISETVLLSVDSKASDCKTSRHPTGFVCLSMHTLHEQSYQMLCEDYVLDCEADTVEFKPTPGQLFSYFNPEDGAWYRARCLNPTQAALIDSSKVVTLKSTDKCKKLSEKYQVIPEFCCFLIAKNVKIEDNLKATLLSKTSIGFNVSLQSVETDALVGEGEILRWIPDVDLPQPSTPATPGAVIIPEVERPDLVNKSEVFLVLTSAPDKVFVRPADIDSQRRYDAVLQDVVEYGITATPLKEPPQKGQVVIAKFEDGLHYRALCKRTNVKQNKYLLEYIEFGNMEVTKLENIYPCPPELDLLKHPAVASQVFLQVGEHVKTWTPAAVEFLDKLKNTDEELLLTLPSGSKTAPSCSEVCLSVVKNSESVNKKVTEMCTPEWKKLEEKGVDVVETENLMFSSLEHLSLPESCEMEVLDISCLEAGTVAGHERGLKHAQYVHTQLSDKMGEYCNSELGKQPYLPKQEELCISQCPSYPQWFRAVLCEQVTGAGGDTATVLFIDYGNMEVVPVSGLRKMLPEFVRSLPAVAVHMEIKDFPKDPTQEMLARAVEYMKINDEGKGFLQVMNCVKVDNGMYEVSAPGLIEAMTMKKPS